MHDQRGVTCNDILGPASFLSRLMRPLPLKNWNKTQIKRWLKKVLLIALYAQFLLHAQNYSINLSPEWFWFVLVGQWGEPGMTLGSWAALLSLLPPRKSLKVLIKKKPAPFLQISALTYYLKHAGETWDGNCNRCGSSLSLVGFFLPTSQGDLGTILLCPT